MSKEKAPTFQFYVENFIGGTTAMTVEQVGCYIRLLCYQWHNGSVPDDIRKQINITKGRKSDVAEVIAEKFKKIGEGILINERLERSRKESDEYREKQSLKGKLSAESKERAKQEQLNQTSTTVEPRLNHDGNQSSTLPLQSSSSINTNTPPSGENENLKVGDEYRPQVEKLAPFVQITQESSLRAATVESASWVRGMAEEYSMSEDAVRARTDEMIKKHILKKTLEQYGWQRVVGFIVDDWRKKESNHKSKNHTHANITLPSDDPAAQDEQRRNAKPFLSDADREVLRRKKVGDQPTAQ